jgi:DNA-binding beta-propeller fold protein YncE
MRRLGAILGLAFTLSVAVPEPAAADTIVSTWQVGKEPFGIAVDPADGRIYVANSKDAPGPGSISVIDPSSRVVNSLTTSGPAALLALDSVHRRLYSSNWNSSLQVFDLTTMSLEATLPVGGLGVVVDPSTRRVYVAEGDSVSVVDGASNTVLATRSAPLGDAWFGLALDPALHHLYVTNIANARPSLVVLDDRDLSLVATVALPVVPRFAIAVDELQHRVYFAGYSPTTGCEGSMFFAIDGSTLAELGSAPASGCPMGMAHDASAHRIYVTHLGDQSTLRGYRVFDDRTFAVVQTAATPWVPGPPALHVDGRLYMGAWPNPNPMFTSPGELVAIQLGNSAPEFIGSWFTPAGPETNDLLLINAPAVDRDLTETGQSQPVTKSYEWSRNGVVIAGQTGATLDLSVVGDRGDTIGVRVTASDGQASAVVTTSVVVANSAPTLTVAFDLAAPTTDGIVTATATSSDADGDPLTYTFTWSVDGVVRSALSSPNVASSFDLGLAGNGDRGQTIVVAVVAFDGTSESATASVSAVIANASPTVTVSLSDLSPQTRDVLVATAGAHDADADTFTLNYAWSVNGTIVQDGASNTFDLAVRGQGDNGDVVVVSATASDGTASGSATASATVSPGRRK